MPPSRNIDIHAPHQEVFLATLATRWLKTRKTFEVGGMTFFTPSNGAKGKYGTNRQTGRPEEWWHHAMPADGVKLMIQAAARPFAFKYLAAEKRAALTALLLRHPDEFGLLWTWARQRIQQHKASDTVKAIGAMTTIVLLEKELPKTGVIEARLHKQYGPRAGGWRKPIEEAAKIVSRKKTAKNRE